MHHQIKKKILKEFIQIKKMCKKFLLLNLENATTFFIFISNRCVFYS